MKLTKVLTLSAVAASMAASFAAQAGNITIESWRTDDKDLWEEVLIPAFNKSHPDVKVVFAPTNPPDYNGAIATRFKGGTAGDLITCRPFDITLGWYNQGNMKELSGQKGMESFPDGAKVAWQTDDGSATYCMPMASVMHGFYYNKEIFKELGLSVPKTQDEFFAVLEKIKSKSRYTPISLGTNDKWEAAEVAYTGIGPNYWKGEEGRKALIAGTAKFSDAEFTGPWQQMAKWGPYMGKGYQAQGYSDSQNLFNLGRAAIYPGGSWEISGFNNSVDFEYGVFYPPVAKAGDQCYISDHTDIGMGINKNSKNPEDAAKFLAWMGSKEFADLYTNKVTGFFSLSKHQIKVEDPVANEMLGWRNSCESTIRVHSQIISRGEPSLADALWNASAEVLNGTVSGEEVAARVQSGFDKSYKK